MQHDLIDFSVVFSRPRALTLLQSELLKVRRKVEIPTLQVTKTP